MAGESTRWQIFGAVKTALATILVTNGYATNVVYVSDILDFVHPESQDNDKFPGCYPMDMDEEISSFEVGIGSAVRLQSNLQVVVTCMLHDRTPSNLLIARTNLMRDVNKVITQDVALTTLLLERPDLNSVTTDKGFYGDNYSVWDQTFTMKYLFNEDDGG